MEEFGMYRTHYCNDIREKDIGTKVQLCGWVDTIRDHGGVIFVDLRDQTGITQTVVHDETLLSNVNKECVVTVSGTVSERDPETVNEKLDTGKVELVVESLTLLGKCKNMLPFDISDSRSTREDVRLKYRYLDLRSDRLHNNIVLRSNIIRTMRKCMEEKAFLEIQTPILTASSPEGARDFLVPSSSSSCSWCRDLTNISRSLPASATRTHARTEAPENSISSILKWLLPHRRMCSRSAKM